MRFRRPELFSGPARPWLPRPPDPVAQIRCREARFGAVDSFDAEAGALLGLSELFLTGGRRSGKTFIMEGLLCSYAVAVPESIVWTVVPTEGFLDEPRKVIAEKVMPRAWSSTSRRGPSSLPNGAPI